MADGVHDLHARKRGESDLCSLSIVFSSLSGHFVWQRERLSKKIIRLPQRHPKNRSMRTHTSHRQAIRRSVRGDIKVSDGASSSITLFYQRSSGESEGIQKMRITKL